MRTINDDKRRRSNRRLRSILLGISILVIGLAGMGLAAPDPAPNISAFYPCRASNTAPNPVVIEGTNLTSGSRVELFTALRPITFISSLADIRYTSDTWIDATVPAGLPEGNYDVRVITPGGTAQAAYLIVNRNVDDEPSQVTGASARVENNNDVIVNWINPPDGDLDSIIIVRSTTHLPQNIADGTIVQDDAETGFIPRLVVAGVPFLDPDLVAGTYYYSIFARDTYGQVNDNLGSTLGVNGATAAAGAGTTTVAPGVTIVLDGNQIGDGITLNWQTDPEHSLVDIYYIEDLNTSDNNYLTSVQFVNTTAPTIWQQVPSGSITYASGAGTADTLRVGNQVGRGNARYYKIVPANTPRTAIDITSNVAGKFDLPVGPPNTHPERAFVSLPIELTSFSITNAIGSQASESDSLSVIDNNFGLIKGELYEGGHWVAISGTPRLDTLTQGQAYLYTGLTERNITLVGKVKELTSSTTLNSGFSADSQFILEWINTAFPFTSNLIKAGLEGTSTGSDSLHASTLSLLDANAGFVGAENGYAEHRGTNDWVDFNNAPADLTLAPGRGYMFTDPTAVPYSRDQER